MYNEPKKGSERISVKDGGRIYREFIDNLLRFCDDSTNCQTSHLAEN